MLAYHVLELVQYTNINICESLNVGVELRMILVFSHLKSLIK